MKRQLDSSHYSKFSSVSYQLLNYDASTVVIPRRNQLLPSIYEMNSEQRFPNHLALDGFIYGEARNDFQASESEQPYSNNLSPPSSEDNEKVEGRITLKASITADPSNEQELPYINYNQFYDSPQLSSNNTQTFQCPKIPYNPSEMQIYTNRNVDPRFLIQYQIPYNSIVTQVHDDMNFVDKSNVIDIQSQSFHNTKLNYLNMHNQMDNNSRIILDPVELKFIPADQWNKGKVSLENLKKDFFCARSSKCLRFEYKLWNALQITKHFPYLFKEIGVRWVAKSYIMVHRDIFGHLLQVTRPSAALFSSCGMFMTHGFREIMLSEVRGNIDPIEIASIDESIVRLFAHKANDFNEDSGAADIIKIKWNNESRKKTEKW